MRAFLARAAALALPALLIGLVAPAVTSAQSISLSVSPDPAEDKPFTVYAHVTGANGHYVDVTIKRAGTTSCAPNADSDDGSIVGWWHGIDGTQTLSDVYKVSDPGRYLLCAWMQQSSSGAIKSTSYEFNVRSARATATISVPATIQPNVTTMYSVTGTTELPRILYVTLKRAGGAGCGSALETDTGRTIWDADIEGAYAVKATLTLDEPGTYLLCAYVQESFSDLDPEVVAQATTIVPGGTSQPSPGTSQPSPYQRCVAAHRAYERSRRLYNSARKKAKQATSRRERSVWRRRAARYRRQMNANKRAVNSQCSRCDKARYDRNQVNRKLKDALKRARRARSARQRKAWRNRANQYRRQLRGAQQRISRYCR